MTSSTGALRLNGLLAALPDDAWGRVRAHLTLVRLPLGKVLYEPGLEIDSVYFPTTTIVSLEYELANGTCAELAVVGNEGMVGIALFKGGQTMSSRAVVDRPGDAYHLKSMILKDEFYRCDAVRSRLLRYTQALITQMAQNVVCNRHHSVDQQMCRWLVGRLDRQNSSELMITQERIAARLGVRRESVTAAASILQQAGLIRYGRGHILVMDRAGLEKRCCECYVVVKQETDRLLRLPAPVTQAAAPKSTGYRRAQSAAKSHDDSVDPSRCRVKAAAHSSASQSTAI